MDIKLVAVMTDSLWQTLWWHVLGAGLWDCSKTKTLRWLSFSGRGLPFSLDWFPLRCSQLGHRKIHFLVPPPPALALFVLNADLGLGKDFPLTSLGHHAGWSKVADWGVLLTERRQLSLPETEKNCTLWSQALTTPHNKDLSSRHLPLCGVM